MSTFNTMQLIKRRFFAMRNGAVADSMRRAGAPYRIIFGLNLPQIVEISRDFAPDADLAMELWRNTTTRESMLLAPMLYPPEQLTPSAAMLMLRSATTAESVDVLCHRLLRRWPQAVELIAPLAEAEADLQRYAAIRLAFNLLPHHTDITEPIARRELERACPLTAATCRLLIDEIEYLRDNQ